MLNILIVDDHEIVRAGVRNVLKITHNPTFIAEAFNETTTKELLRSTEFQLIIMDVQMPNTDTVGMINYIRNNYSNTKLLMFSMTAEKIYADKYYNEGVMGFVAKSAGLNELSKAIDLVLSGRKYFSDSFMEHLAQENQQHLFENPFNKLSNKELELSKELMKGTSVVSIAKRLGINSSTLASHKANIFQKLDVSNVVELITIGKLHHVSIE